MTEERIAKIISRSGIASRRKAEELIRAGKVRVNGKVISECGTKVSEADRISVDGTVITRDASVTIALNKPRGYITTRNDTHDRKTVYDLLPKKYHGLHPIGRLDKETSGLLLFTNDGDLTNKVTHPRYGVRKKYRVTLVGKLKQKDVQLLQKGFTHPEFEVSPCVVSQYEYKAAEKRCRFIFDIGEGKKREIRKIFEYLDYELLRLHRIQIGSYRMIKVRVGGHIVLRDSDVVRVLTEEKGHEHKSG